MHTDPARRRAYMTDYQAQHREEFAAKARQRYLDQREAKLLKQRAWREANRERHRAYSRRWSAEHPELTRIASRRFREQQPVRRWAILQRSRGCPPTEEAVAHAELIWGDPCSYCGGPSDSIDHIVPVKVGGETTADNITAACRPCNSKKGTRSLLEFLCAGGKTG